jgi:hypothetical protein
MTLTAAGNLGVGTPTPPTKFAVKDGTDTVIQYYASGADGYLGMGNEAGSIGGGGKSFNLLTGTEFTFSTAGTKRVIIDSSGRTSIGYTTNPSTYMLDVNGTGRFANGVNMATTSGNVGIGTSNPGTLLQVEGALLSGFVNIRSFDSASMAANVGGGISFGGKYETSGTYTDFGFIKGMKENGTSADYAGYINFYTRVNGGSFTERMRITSGGNVGIGVNPTTTTFQVQGSVNNNLAFFNNTSSSGYATARFFNDTSKEAVFGVGGSTSGSPYANNGYIYTGASTDLVCVIGTTEKMRITSGGELFIGSPTFTGIPAFVGIQANTGNYNPIAIKDTGTTYGSGYRFIAFYNSSASIAGSIEHTGVTTTNYNTSSDIRLKKDLGVSIKSIIDEVIIHDFEWIEDEIIDKGVFAQELYKHKPLAVSIGKDDLTEDGKLAQPWGVDYSKLVPELIIYCQDLKKTITSLQNRLIKLENK